MSETTWYEDSLPYHQTDKELIIQLMVQEINDAIDNVVSAINEETGPTIDFTFAVDDKGPNWTVGSLENDGSTLSTTPIVITIK